MQQMNEIYDFIDFRNQTYATIEKLYRVDVRDYPEIAVREALLNLLVHRDYSFSASYGGTFHMQKSESCKCVLSIALNRGIWYRNRKDYEGVRGHAKKTCD